MAGLLQFLIEFKTIILFYLAIVIWIIIKRKKFDIQAKIIFLYRMKFGLKWMDRFAKRFREWIILMGYVGVGAGFIGLVFIAYVLFKNIFDYLTADTVVSGASIVYPGMTVPGLGVLPFWDWIIAIFIIAVIHEFSHGIVARAHKVPVLNTGIVLFGPILGAFVEPNEKKLRKENDIVQYSILAAGSWSNIILAVVALIMMNWVLVPAVVGITEPVGVTFQGYQGDDFPAAIAGLPIDSVIVGIDDAKVSNLQESSVVLAEKKAGDTIRVITTEGEYPVTLTEHPNDPSKGYLGILGLQNEIVLKEGYQSGFWSLFRTVAERLAHFLKWLFLLSFGIGLFNLLPLPIVDGGRMAQVFLHKLKGKVVGEKRYHQVSLFFLLVLLLNLFYPVISKLF